MTGSVMLVALLLLMATGCTKEEVVAPSAIPQVSKNLKPVHGNSDQGDTTIVPSNTGNSVSPITDDGDDLGDKERSSKPKS